MDVNKARDIINGTRGDHKQTNRFLKGIMIISTLGGQEHNLLVNAEHDIVYVGVDNMTIDELLSMATEEEIKNLAKYGWHLEEEFDSFGKYV